MSELTPERLQEARDYALKLAGKAHYCDIADELEEMAAGLDLALSLSAENARLRKACRAQEHEISQTLGRALGYPRYVDDPATFPGATEADGVCTGDHVAETLALQAAEQIERAKKVEQALHGLLVVLADGVSTSREWLGALKEANQPSRLALSGSE